MCVESDRRIVPDTGELCIEPRLVLLQQSFALDLQSDVIEYRHEALLVELEQTERQKLCILFAAADRELYAHRVTDLTLIRLILGDQTTQAVATDSNAVKHWRGFRRVTAA